MTSFSKVFAAMLAVAAIVGVVSEQVGERSDRKRLPQIGRSVDIGGRSLNIFCSGDGSPTVVFDAGANQPGYAWAGIQPEVATTCVGMAASMGAILLLGGAKGKRFALPNATVMLHQASGGFEGTAADIEIRAKEILRLQNRIREIIQLHTNQPMERVSRDSDRDFFMTPDMALEYGIVDHIIGHPKEAAEDNNTSPSCSRASRTWGSRVSLKNENARSEKAAGRIRFLALCLAWRQ